jgi:hypothetical protein
MCAWIKGMFLEAIDGNSFRLKRLLSDEENQFQYQPIERIRMHGVESPDLRTYDGILARQRLNSRFQHKVVRCVVVFREPDDFLLCEVRVEN